MSDRASDRARLCAAIEHDAAIFGRTLADACPAPPGHRWHSPSPTELLWWRGEILESTMTGVCFDLDPDAVRIDAPRHYHAEVRWYWRHDGAFAPHPRARHHALVRCEQLPVRGFAFNLLDAPEVCLFAETVADLGDRAGAALRRIILS